jgi:hypothetical protein
MRRAERIIRGLRAGLHAGVWSLSADDAQALERAVEAGAAGDLSAFAALVGRKKKVGTPGYGEPYQRKRLEEWYTLRGAGMSKEEAARQLGTTARQVQRDLDAVGTALVSDWVTARLEVGDRQRGEGPGSDVKDKTPP